jgi:AcrR family transcriptional regulator
MVRAFTRARRPEEKEQRRAHLLATGRALLEGGVALQALSLNELARQAQMAKANVYLYFESREALLLALLSEEWTRWFDAFSRELEGRRAESVEGLAQRLARSLAERDLLCALTAALPSVLEQNLSEEAIVAFKRETLALFGRIAEALERKCPALPAAAHAALLYDTAYAVVGLYPSTHPSPAAARALQAPDLGFFRRDFADELERFVLALAAHHAAPARPKAKPKVPRRARA